MTKDIETYLRELQVALAAAGADPALVQDALFDAEEHLQSEMAVLGQGDAGGGGGALPEAERAARFAAVVEGYGTPEEVAAAYAGTVPATEVARAMTGQPMAAVAAPIYEMAGVMTAEPGNVAAAPAAPAAPAGQGGQDAPAAQAPSAEAGPRGMQACPGCGAGIEPRQAYCRHCGTRLQTGGSAAAGGSYAAPAGTGGWMPAGVQYGMQVAGAGSAPRRGVWWDIFSPFADGRVWTSLVYMLLSLGTGIAYFTILVTGVSVGVGMIPAMLIGVVVLVGVLGVVRAISLFEGRLVETLLGTRMPRRLRPTPPNLGFFQRIAFWLGDGRTWASMAYMLLMLPLGIIYFTIAVTGFAVGLGLVSTPFWAWSARLGHYVITVDGVAHQWWFPAWGIPFCFVAGILVLIGMMHLVKWIGRGHAAFAKAMLVRLK